MPRGQPKRFNSGKQLIALFRTFCDEIVDNNFMRVPNQTNFCNWLSEHYNDCDRKTIYNALNKYFPNVKKEFEQIQSDVIAEGGMLGKYQSAMSIFALKNWCRWQDKPSEEETDTNRFTELIEGLKDE